MSEPVISIRGVGKKYRLGATISSDTLRDQIAHAFKLIYNRKSTKFSSNETKRTKIQRRDNSDFWALCDISFDVNQGEVIGIIGRNGAGKSTLLKILSEITEPTSGEIRIRGRVGSLLEVGTGFHPELSGRENIFLNGAILGMTRAEIKEKFDEIVAFSEIDKFLDTPVKRYSSGMYVRLAFAVAAHLDPEILLIDEVFAVGDVRFQKKCLGKMDEVSRSGRTILFVSHNMDAILNLCSAVYVIEGGQISKRFSPEEGVRCYLTVNIGQSLDKRPRFQLVHRPPIIHDIKIYDDEGRANIVPVGQGLHFDIILRDFKDLSRIYCSIAITNQRNQRVVVFHMRYHSNITINPSDYAEVACYVPSLPLIPDNYNVDIILGDGINVIEKMEQAAQLEVIFSDILGTGSILKSGQGNIVLPCEWSSKQARCIN